MRASSLPGSRRGSPKAPSWPANTGSAGLVNWGAPHHVADAKVVSDELAWMLQQGYSVTFYMFHGGTSFGWMNGANWDDDSYQPDVTSYDYDSPLDESGRPTPKYLAAREVIARETGITPPPVPATPATQ